MTVMNVKKRQIMTATLVIALGAAVLVNWYYNEPADKYSEDTTLISGNVSVSGNLGDSVLVAATVDSTEAAADTSAKQTSDEFFSEAKLRRSQSNDKITDTINEILDNKKLLFHFRME